MGGGGGVVFAATGDGLDGAEAGFEGKGGGGGFAATKFGFKGAGTGLVEGLFELAVVVGGEVAFVCAFDA